jgi:hypothetical protein
VTQNRIEVDKWNVIFGDQDNNGPWHDPIINRLYVSISPMCERKGEKKRKKRENLERKRAKKKI